MADKQAAIGTLLWIGDAGSPEVFFLVPSSKDMTGPKEKTDTVDVTTQDSPDQYKEFIASLKQGGDLTFPIEFDPNAIEHNETATVAGTNAGGLKYLYDQRVKRNMHLVFPTTPAMRLRFKGLVVGFEYDNKVAGSMLTMVTVKTSGKPTLELGGGTP